MMPIDQMIEQIEIPTNLPHVEGPFKGMVLMRDDTKSIYLIEDNNKNQFTVPIERQLDNFIGYEIDFKFIDGYPHVRPMWKI